MKLRQFWNIVLQSIEFYGIFQNWCHSWMFQPYMCWERDHTKRNNLKVIDTLAFEYFLIRIWIIINKIWFENNLHDNNIRNINSLTEVVLFKVLGWSLFFRGQRKMMGADKKQNFYQIKKNKTNINLTNYQFLLIPKRAGKSTKLSRIWMPCKNENEIGNLKCAF